MRIPLSAQEKKNTLIGHLHRDTCDTVCLKEGLSFSQSGDKEKNVI